MFVKLNNNYINNLHRVDEKKCHFKGLAETMLPHAMCGYFNLTINADEIVKQKAMGLGPSSRMSRMWQPHFIQHECSHK